MPVTATKLREDLYGTLDQVIETGSPVEILRNGHLLRIELVGAKSKLDSLIERDVMAGDPEELVSMDWSGYWSEAPRSKANKAPKAKISESK